MNKTLYTYQAKLIKVVDGDTLDLEVDLGFKVSIKIRARLQGIDTPEIWGVKKESQEYQEGMKAKQFVEDWFVRNGTCIVKTIKDKQGKYGRWIARVFSSLEDEELNSLLLQEGLAVAVNYD